MELSGFMESSGSDTKDCLLLRAAESRSYNYKRRWDRWIKEERP